MYKFHHSRKVRSPLSTHCKTQSRQLELKCASLRMKQLTGSSAAAPHKHYPSSPLAPSGDNATFFSSSSSSLLVTPATRLSRQRRSGSVFGGLSFAPFTARGAVLALALSPARQHLAVSRGDHGVYIFEIDCQASSAGERFTCVADLRVHSRTVIGICFDSEHTLATVCNDGKVCISDFTLPVGKRKLASIVLRRGGGPGSRGAIGLSALAVSHRHDTHTHTHTSTSSESKKRKVGMLLLTCSLPGQSGKTCAAWDFGSHIRTREGRSAALVDARACARFGWLDVLAGELLDDCTRVALVVVRAVPREDGDYAVVELVQMDNALLGGSDSDSTEREREGEEGGRDTSQLDVLRGTLMQLKLPSHAEVHCRAVVDFGDNGTVAVAAVLAPLPTDTHTHTRARGQHAQMHLVVASTAADAFGDVISRGSLPEELYERGWTCIPTSIKFCMNNQRLCVTCHHSQHAAPSVPRSTHAPDTLDSAAVPEGGVHRRLFESDSSEEEEEEEEGQEEGKEGGSGGSFFSSHRDVNALVCRHAVFRTADLKCVVAAAKEQMHYDLQRGSYGVINAAVFHPVAGLIRGSSTGMLEVQM